MPYIWAAGLQTAEEAGAGRAPHSDWDKGTKREVREKNRRKCTVNARREILMHSCISEMLFVRSEGSLQSHFSALLPPLVHYSPSAGRDASRIYTRARSMAFSLWALVSAGMDQDDNAEVLEAKAGSLAGPDLEDY